MEFYKIVGTPLNCCLEEEQGQQGLKLDNTELGIFAFLLYLCYLKQADLMLHFRRYLTVYYKDGGMEYVALKDASILQKKKSMDGFATTWLEGEEENRVWIGADGAIENRGKSTEKVKQILEYLIRSYQAGQKSGFAYQTYFEQHFEELKGVNTYETYIDNSRF